MMRHTLFFVGLRGLLAGCMAALALSAAAQKPNVIVILLDDMGYSDLGCFGSQIQTPHLDRLATDGVRFRQFFNAGKCEPTRASLISGQYWPEVGLKLNRGITFGQAMQRAGYRTLAVGKWHMEGNPVDRGFDRYFGHLSGASDFFIPNAHWRLDDQPLTDAEKGDDFYATDRMTDYAIDFIQEATEIDPQQPFFMYLAYNAPHSPLQARPNDIAKYTGRFMAGWDALRQQRYHRMVENGLLETQWELPPRPDSIPAWDTLTEEEKVFEDARMAVYAAMIDSVDQNIGRLQTALAKLNLADNTLILFMSDNGASPYDRRRFGQLGVGGTHWNHGLGWAWLANTPYRHFKRHQHNGGALTSAFAHWPAGIPAHQAGAIVDAPCHIIDVMPTLLDAGGFLDQATTVSDPLPSMPGRSLLPLLQGQAPAPRGPLYFQLMDHGGIVLDGWQLVRADSGPWELYDLTADRTQTNNLIQAHPEKAASLQTVFEDVRSKWGVKWRPQSPPHRYLPMDTPRKDLN